MCGELNYNMRRLLVLSLFLSVFIANDEYPYFTDVSKQLEFEERRIYVNEVEKKEMILSGGSQYNLYHLFDKNQPAIVAGDIETSYKYSYNFEIVQNNVFLDELSFLKIIGLEDRAKKYFNEQMELHTPYKTVRKTLLILLIESGYSLDNLPIPAEKIKELKAKRKISNNFYMMGLVFPLIGVIEIIASDFEDNNMLIFSTILGIGSMLLGYQELNKDIIIELKNQFIYKQKLSNQQLTSLADSYNRRIYKEIQSK